MTQGTSAWWAICVLAIGACDGDDGGPGDPEKVAGNASILHGPAPMASPAQARTGAHVVPTDGWWVVSPDQLRLRLTQLVFGSDSMGLDDIAIEDCVIPYERDGAGLSQLVDCPFEVDEGSWTEIRLTIDSTYEVLIDDDANGLYTDPTSPTLLTVDQPPAGGAAFVEVTTGFQVFPTIALADPLVLGPDDTASLSVVVSGLQFLSVYVEGGTARFGGSGGVTEPGMVSLAASVGEPARVGYYVRDTINTALSFNLESIAFNPPPNGRGGPRAVSTFYSGSSTPSLIQLVLAGVPADCPVGVPVVHNGPPGPNQGGYLGLDGDGVLGWASATDQNWTMYDSLWSMDELTTLGDTTTVRCVPTSTDPAPPGDSFSSGAPDTSAATYTQDLVLVAD
jgi:hypothetical protein